MGVEWDAMAPNYGTPPVTLVRGAGCQVWDDEGNEYTDLLAGIAVNALGHAHPAVVAAVQAQIETLGHTSNLYAHPQGIRLAKRLSERTRHGKVLFTNSGTEANEAAWKAVWRRATAQGRAENGVVLAFQNSFHGRSMGALAVTGQGAYREGFGTFPGRTLFVPFNDEAALAAAFEKYDIIGVFAECIQGEGGVVPMRPAFARALGAACKAAAAVLVVDEVQTGIARTGTFWAHEQYGLEPGIVTAAKGLGGGLPIGACIMAPEVAQHLGPGSHGCTFGGNPISAAAGNAVLDIIEAEELGTRAFAAGLAFMQKARASGLVVRGSGLLIGIYAPERAGDVVAKLREQGWLVGQAGAHVVRLAPPLVVDAKRLLEVVEPLVTAIGPTPRA